MESSHRGTIRGGKIELDDPLPLLEGEQVIVHIEQVDSSPVVPRPAPASEDFLSSPFFGLWADRTDLGTSVDHVRESRSRWRKRLSRPD
jgi:hypothetical protein